MMDRERKGNYCSDFTVFFTVFWVMDFMVFCKAILEYHARKGKNGYSECVHQDNC